MWTSSTETITAISSDKGEEMIREANRHLLAHLQMETMTTPQSETVRNLAEALTHLCGVTAPPKGTKDED